ncbi:MAG TPA: hypothetical protein VGR32_09710 [Brevundimonas sp.]|jgi:hypothetical protein|uniref:hypothetical protein n=1 Tax=Brevundimonas sp. TaxID=1871086 RepID=UPI002DF36B7C|nr:hypothetical protein [Brevundimonas sp.]
MRVRVLAPFAALLVLAACDAPSDGTPGASTPGAQPGATPPEPAPAGPPPPPQAGPLTPAGPPQTLAPDGAADVQQAAAVVQLDQLQGQGGLTVKMFGTGGGDPAMNGLYTHVAFFVDPAEGWRVFRVGDFLAYRVLSSGPGRVDVEVEESVMDPATSAISSRSRRLIVGWAAGPNGAAPAQVTVTPAR